MIHAPSLRSHYSSFSTTTSMSAPASMIRARCRFSRSLEWPDLNSRRLNTGCRVISKQVSMTLIRGWLYTPILTSPKISMLHQSVHFRSTFQVPHDSRSLPSPESLTTSPLTVKQHQVVWSVCLHTLTGGPASIHPRAWSNHAANLTSFT